MSAKGEEKRQQIVDAADTLFYHQGYTATSFADIAEKAGVPKGNFYFYFHTKEELLDAVVRNRLKRMAAQLDALSQEFPDPRQRLHRIAEAPFYDHHEVAQYGCPMGTLSAELCKLTAAKQNPMAAMYSLLLITIRHGMEGMGVKHEDAEHQARHLLARLQGAANLAHTFKDERWLQEEIESTHAWIDSL